MAWTAPTQHLKKKELLNNKTFYRKLSKQCNFVDDGSVFIWYIGLVGLIGEELRKNKFVRLPHLGDMAIITQKARPAWVGRTHMRIGPTEILKFYPKEKLRRYMRTYLNSRAGH